MISGIALAANLVLFGRLLRRLGLAAAPEDSRAFLRALELVGYDELLDVFWSIHDPTTRNRQGWDFGSQYRSAIFFHDAEQEKLAGASRERRQAELSRPIVTEIVPAPQFYDAEEYHQRYFEKHGGAACATTLR